MQVKEVPLRNLERKKLRICSLPVRAICESLIILVIFVPVLLFLFKWPSAKNLIHGKVLSVSLHSIMKSIRRKNFL